jgi:hypothetical protein
MHVITCADDQVVLDGGKGEQPELLVDFGEPSRTGDLRRWVRQRPGLPIGTSHWNWIRAQPWSWDVPSSPQSQGVPPGRPTLLICCWGACGCLRWNCNKTWS